MPATRLICSLLAIAALCAGPGVAAQTPANGAIVHRITLPAAPVADAASLAGSVQFIGTATVIIRYQGLTILTDPNFLHKGEHVHLGYGLRSRRLTNPAIAFEQLPPIDLVILSHLHEDHFDTLVQQRLDRDVPIVTTREASENLSRMGFRKTLPLSTWEALEVRKGEARLTVTSMPGRHGPAGVAVLLPAVMGAMLDFAEAADQPRYRMYISGDTLVFDDIALIPHRFPDIDLALLHLGGTRLLGLLKVTMDGRDGVQMMQIIAPRRAIPIHYNDYGVFKSPLSEFEQAVAAAGLQGKVSYLQHGERYLFETRHGAKGVK